MPSNTRQPLSWYSHEPEVGSRSIRSCRYPHAEMCIPSLATDEHPPLVCFSFHNSGFGFMFASDTHSLQQLSSENLRVSTSRKVESGKINGCHDFTATFFVSSGRVPLSSHLANVVVENLHKHLQKCHLPQSSDGKKGSDRNKRQGKECH
jgi:hypothetical protein